MIRVNHFITMYKWCICIWDAWIKDSIIILLYGPDAVVETWIISQVTWTQYYKLAMISQNPRFLKLKTCHSMQNSSMPCVSGETSSGWFEPFNYFIRKARKTQKENQTGKKNNSQENSTPSSIIDLIRYGGAGTVWLVPFVWHATVTRKCHTSHALAFSVACLAVISCQSVDDPG